MSCNIFVSLASHNRAFIYKHLFINFFSLQNSFSLLSGLSEWLTRVSFLHVLFSFKELTD